MTQAERVEETTDLKGEGDASIALKNEGGAITGSADDETANSESLTVTHDGSTKRIAIRVRGPVTTSLFIVAIAVTVIFWLLSSN